MAFVRYPKGTKLSNGSVADGNTEYNDAIVKAVGSSPAPSSNNQKNSSVSAFSIDVGRSNPYTFDSNLVTALRNVIKNGQMTPDQAASALIMSSTGANADALKISNPLSQIKSMLTTGLGTSTQSGRVGEFNSSGVFQPTQTTVRQSVTESGGSSVKTSNQGGYVAIPVPGSSQLAYFQDTPQGLVAVNDGNVIQRLKGGTLAAKQYNSIFDVPSSAASPVEKAAEDYAKAVYSSGLGLNTNIDESKFNLLSYQDLMNEADKIVAPFFQERLKTVKNDLQLFADRIGIDLGKAEDSITRESNKSRLSGNEELAGRGLAFSGRKDTFESDLTSETNRAIEDKRTLAFRNAEDALYKAEGQVGSSGLSGISISSPNYSASISPRGGVTGSDVYESRANTRDLARALASDENLRRQEAYNSYIRSLSFS